MATGKVRVTITDGEGVVFDIREISGDALEWLKEWGSPGTMVTDAPEVVEVILQHIADACRAESVE